MMTELSSFALSVAIFGIAYVLTKWAYIGNERHEQVSAQMKSRGYERERERS